MALMTGAQAAVGGAVAPVVVDTKAKKLEALAAFKERRAEQAKAKKQAATKLKEELVRAGLFDKLTQDVKDYVNSEVEGKASAAKSGGTFEATFGAGAKAGATVTLAQLLAKDQALALDMKRHIKEWAKKGIVVDSTPNPNAAEYRFTVKSIA